MVLFSPFCLINISTLTVLAHHMIREERVLCPNKTFWIGSTCIHSMCIRIRVQSFFLICIHHPPSPVVGASSTLLASISPSQLPGTLRI
jgi:hypothetical protein